MKRMTEHDEDEIDRVLSREDEILPSSGFAVSVMDAVRREAATPPPIPFPWKLALPGLVVAGLTLVLTLVAGVAVIAQLGRTSTAAELSMSWQSVLTSIFRTGTGLGLQRDLESAAIWTALALLATWVSVKLSMRFASGWE
jgi:hypothetical protein